MATFHGPPEISLRLKSAAIGFGVTLATIAILAGAQFLLAPHTVAVVGRMDPEIDAWAVSQLRWQLTEFYTTVIAMMTIYWLLGTLAGRGQLLRVRSANVTLALSGAIFALAMAVATFIQVPEAFKGACPVLGISDTFSPLPEGVFGFDRQTPCEISLRRAVPSLLFGLPIILLIASAFLRIFGSRKQR